MGRLGRYFHTLRHLRPRQLWFQAMRRIARPNVDTSPAPPLRPGAAHGWIVPARRDASLAGPHTMRFLGRTGMIDELGWSGPGASQLWRYNQHYFDDLAAAGAADRGDWHCGLISRWMADNPPASRPGWDPYPTSLRLVNWSKWLLSGAEPVAGMAQSMAIQARFLTANLEYHVLGNHLLANAKALMFAGALFEGRETADWLRLGLRIWIRELAEQVLPDGGNYERSPMYHALGLEDLLDLVNLAQARPGSIEPRVAAGWRQTAAAMRFWLDAMCHPDGEIAHFNDAAIEIAPSPAELGRYADALDVGPVAAAGVEVVAEGIVHLRDSGYVRAERGDAVLLCDVAPLGPDYLPAHGHADTLSFELSVGGKRVVVNGGTSLYEPGPERVAERGTAAHSTVTVAGENSSEVWSSFRVARRAHPFDISIHFDNGDAMIAASHDGYRRLAGSPVHRRTWRLGERSLAVTDTVKPARPAVARFIAHPAITLEESSDGSTRIGPVRIAATAGRMALAPAAHSARFGDRRPTQAVCVELQGGRSSVSLTW